MEEIKQPEFAPGTVIGCTYVIDKKIAETALSSIYKGRNGRTEEIVAIKALNQQASKEGVDLERITRQMFCNEELLMRSLDHPGIPKCYGLFSEKLEGKRVPVRVMEYVPSHLDAFFKDKPFMPRLGEFISQFADVISYLHENGIIHGDIKPQNILCNRDEIKLIDFNNATSDAEKPLRIKINLPAGYQSLTREFAAPEIKNGNPAVFASDIYSFGRVLDKILIANSIDDYSILKGQSSRISSPEMQALQQDDEEMDKPKVMKTLMDLPLSVSRLYHACISHNFEQRIGSNELKYMAMKIIEDSKKPTEIEQRIGPNELKYRAMKVLEDSKKPLK